MSLLQDFFEKGSRYADHLTEMAKVVDIGLGDTTLDVLASAYTLSSYLEQRTADGRLNPDATTWGYMAAQVHLGGLPRIRLSHGLAAKLALTDPKGVDADELRWPFPHFVLELPYPQGAVVIDGHDVPFVMVSCLRHDEGARLSSNTRFESLYELLSALKRMKEVLRWPQRRIHAAIVSDADTIPTPWMTTERAVRIEDYTRVPGLPVRQGNACVAVMRIIVNLAIYLKYVDTRFSDPDGLGGKSVNSDHGGSMLYEVGNEVKLERELRDAARAFSMGEKTREQWKLAKRFIVRGHWKRQSCGEGRTERRITFVEPYWKGPSDAPVLARVHVGGE